ncbi:MAG TPA: tRNA (adenosine(37)-N6)-threonylcarbamoyltransferase complex dimerization subunit type 1 TsaB [Acidobacteriota bacterium]|nr:tRNA (adenosine(37)-N6)-threonylcarbamoyltransferase complex dimerization subunit type 1 TsaB [Acidobacteriota bacterium]
MMMPLSFAPRILAFDTSTVRGSVALLEGSKMQAEFRLQSVQTHSRQLLNSVDFLLGRIGWNLGDVNLVSVGNGPGSFTGIRIGIATALGIAHSLSIPFVEISGLDALAHKVCHLDGRIGAVMDAHRSQAFYGEYEAKNGRIRQTQKPVLLDISSLEHHLRGRHLYLVGDPDICESVGSPATSLMWPRQVAVDLFLAVEIGKLAFISRRKWRSGESIAAEPMYIRPPDALKKKTQ